METIATRQAQYQARLPAVIHLIEAGHWAEAVDSLRAIVATESDLAVAHNDLAAVCFQAGRLAEARASVRRAAELCQHDGELARTIRDNFAAIDAATRAANPAAAYEACVEVVNRLVARDELALAVAELERFVAAHPSAAEAWNDLAIVQQATERLQPALIASGIACEIDSYNADFRRTRAAILLDAGRCEDAGKVIAPVLIANRDDIDALILAGDITVAAGHPAEARPFYRHALEIDPECGRAALQLASLPMDPDTVDTGPAATLVLILSSNGAAAVDQTLRTFARHCQDQSQIDVKVLYHATGVEETRLYQAIAAEHPFATLVAEREMARQLPALLGPHRHVLLASDDTLFVRDFCLTDAARALDIEPRALGCALALGENTAQSPRSRRSQRVPALTRFAHGLCRYAWNNSDQDFGRPLGAVAGLYRADEIRRLLGKLSFSSAPSLDAALEGAAGLFTGSRPMMLCFDRAVAAPRAGEDSQAAAAFRTPSLAQPLPMAV
ncbi:MAG TPA: tetratricopeptide repeat protein [Polyangia bacterium]|nr:tetratricopeptide repeat protein [Polyangia bacterium]